MAQAPVSANNADLTPTEQRNIETLHEMLTHFNRQNPAGMLATFNDDMEWLDVPMEQSYRGQREVEAFLERLFIAFPDVTYDLNEVVAQGDFLTAKFTMHGTHMGPFYGIPPTNRHVDLPCLSLIKMRDGKFDYDHCYFDTGQCLRQMGLFPPLSVTESPVGQAAFWLAVKRGLVAKALGGMLAVMLLVKGLRKARS